MASVPTFDVAVVGAGPVGSMTALAKARAGANVLLLEANPKAAGRFAGEWLHPPAVRMMRAQGIEIPDSGLDGEGFVVHADDAEGSIVLPYASGSLGLSCEHHELVGAIRETAASHPNVNYQAYAKVRELDGQNVTYVRRRTRSEVTARAETIVGADGRASVVRSALGLDVGHVTSSRMAGLLLEDAELPIEGFGHVFLGGPGPVLAYRIAPGLIRICIDVPLHVRNGPGRTAFLWEAYAPVLSAGMRPAYKRALSEGRLQWAANQVRPRIHYGRDGMVLVGDAVGHHHPLTACGMTLGFGDALELARTRSFDTYRRRRLRDTRVPEMLAVALYEVFADHADETVAIRRAVYGMWRRSAAERLRTMRFLACEDIRPHSFAWSFAQAMLRGVTSLTVRAGRSGYYKHCFDIGRALLNRARHLSAGMLRKPSSLDAMRDRAHNAQLKAALNVSVPVAEVVDLKRRQNLPDDARTVDPSVALERGAQALAAQQSADGDWEGEVVWCPMLPAQYVMMCHITGQPISEERKTLIRRQFESTQLDDGLWGLHEHSEPYLFVTTLVYVAARLIGVGEDDALLQPARRFIRAEGGVTAIPSWGKFWLAMLNLYDWSGVNAVLPEAWSLPRSVPLHPSNYYCHTRLIYMAMATIYGSGVQAPATPLIESLRDRRRSTHRTRPGSEPSSKSRISSTAITDVDCDTAPSSSCANRFDGSFARAITRAFRP